MKNTLNDNITILFDGKKLELKCGVIGGRLADDTNATMGMFFGLLDIEEGAITMLHAMRAFIKMVVDDFDGDMQRAESLLHFIVEDAIKREIENESIDNATLKQHETVLKMRKDYPDRRH